MKLCILWDASDIWGCLALWAARSLGLPYRLVRGHELEAGLLDREAPALLLVPGGLARRKAAALGDGGQEAVRRYVAAGGQYLGFCGGAGLGLSGSGGLSLCPWNRGAYAEHMQHFMSGHLTVEAAAHPLTPGELPASPLLPVWWPGRFNPDDAEKHDGVAVLARYAAPGPDFWLADLPVASLPAGAFSEWGAHYGFSLSPTFLAGQPSIVHGRYGKGAYTLSYSHLETPDSPDANAWFAHLLRELGGLSPLSGGVTAWNLASLPSLWDDTALLGLRASLVRILDTGCGAGLFFSRTPWLVGWRTGLPGAALNTLRAQLCSILSQLPTEQALRLWQAEQEAFLPLFNSFAERVTSYLLAERLAMTLSKALPEALVPERLRAERAELFGGSGMTAVAGGLYGRILPLFEELLFLQFRGESGSR